MASQKTRDVHPSSLKCWPNVCAAVPTLKRRWVNVSCLLCWITDNIYTPHPLAGPDGSFVSAWACNLGVPGSNLGWSDICHRGCAYTVLQTVQNHEVYNAAYGTVHYKEPLKSFEIRVGHGPDFGLPSIAIWPWLCRKRRKAIFIYMPIPHTLWNLKKGRSRHQFLMNKTVCIHASSPGSSWISKPGSIDGKRQWTSQSIQFT